MTSPWYWVLFVLICVIIYFGFYREWRRIKREWTSQQWRDLNEAMANFGASLYALGVSAKFASQKMKEFGEVFTNSISKE